MPPFLLDGDTLACPGVTVSSGGGYHSEEPVSCLGRVERKGAEANNKLIIIIITIITINTSADGHHGGGHGVSFSAGYGSWCD